MRDSYEVLYDASVRQADDNLRAVIDVLKARNLWDKALFIAVADHGEEVRGTRHLVPRGIRCMRP